jgi:prephenate dehydrogenase
MTPEEHDRVVAVTSHLPQLLSTALAAEAARVDAAISGPGLADMTRLAGSAWEIWEDILRTNSGPICAALDSYIARLERIRTALPDLRPQFEEAQRLRKATRLVGE